MLRRLLPLCAGYLALAIFAALPGAADTVRPAVEPDARIGATADRLAARLADRDRLLAGHGLQVPAPTGAAPDVVAEDAAAPGHAPKATLSDVRLGLMQVALAAGAAGQPEILAALPGEDATAIYLREGSARLSDLARLSAEAGHPDALRQDGDSYTATVPIFVMLGARLSIAGGETLALSSGDGAFLVSFGALSVTGATLRAADVPAGEPDAFRPFLASLGTGSLRLRDSLVSGLGFAAGSAFAGVAVVTEGLYRPDRASAIVNNRFDDIGGISVTGGDGVRIEGNAISGARRTALWIDASDNASLRRNIVTATRGNHLLRFGGPSRGGVLADNVFSIGAHAALRLDDHAVEVELSGNLIEAFQGSALELDEGARCVWVHGNVIRDNGGSALRIAVDGPLAVTGNAILDNGGTGLVLSGGAEEMRLLVARNVIGGNRAGIRSATQARLRLAENDLSDQLPRLVSGDLAQHTPLFLHAMRGGGTADLDIVRVAARPAAAPLPQDAGARAFAACRDGGDS